MERSSSRGSGVVGVDEARAWLRRRIAPAAGVVLLAFAHPGAAAGVSHEHHGHGGATEATESGDDAHAGHGDAHAGHSASPGVARSTHRYTAPDVVLTDQRGGEVTLPELFAGAEPILLNFIFTSCTAICPPMSATFARVQQRLGDDLAGVRLVSISIDPEYDTPERMAVYADRFGASEQWSMLTGSLEDCIAVQKAFDTYRGDKMFHAPVTLVRASVDGDWIRYDGFVGATELADEARALAATP